MTYKSAEYGKFKGLLNRLVAVPYSVIVEREAEYKRQSAADGKPGLKNVGVSTILLPTTLSPNARCRAFRAIPLWTEWPVPLFRRRPQP